MAREHGRLTSGWMVARYSPEDTPTPPVTTVEGGFNFELKLKQLERDQVMQVIFFAAEGMCQ
jgi:hypothetical protein